MHVLNFTIKIQIIQHFHPRTRSKVHSIPTAAFTVSKGSQWNPGQPLQDIDWISVGSQWNHEMGLGRFGNIKCLPPYKG